MRPRTRCVLNLSGPYAVGKDSILNALLSTYPEQTYRVRTITTRPVSPEADPSYESVAREEFEKRVSRGQWIANYQLSGATAYATDIDEINIMAARGRICVLSVFAGPTGAGRLREVFGTSAYSIGLLPIQGSLETQLAVLRSRLLARNRDEIEALNARIGHQTEPLRYVLENPVVDTPHGAMRVFDEVVVNDQLETTIKEIVQKTGQLFSLT